MAKKIPEPSSPTPFTSYTNIEIWGAGLASEGASALSCRPDTVQQVWLKLYRLPNKLVFFCFVFFVSGFICYLFYISCWLKLCFLGEAVSEQAVTHKVCHNVHLCLHKMFCTRSDLNQWPTQPELTKKAIHHTGCLLTAPYISIPKPFFSSYGFVGPL